MTSKKSRVKAAKKAQAKRNFLHDKISHAEYHLKKGMHGHHGKKNVNQSSINL